VGAGETGSFVGTADGEAVRDGESEGKTVGRAVGEAVGGDGAEDAGVEGTGVEGIEVTSVGRKGVDVGRAAHPDCVGVGRIPNTSIWLSRKPPTSMQMLRIAIVSPPTSCASPASPPPLARTCSPTAILYLLWKWKWVEGESRQLSIIVLRR
jgi:hypothetical protein